MHLGIFAVVLFVFGMGFVAGRATRPNERVTGIGGVFFKAKDPAKLYDWYEKHLGLTRKGEEGVVFNWRAAEGSEHGRTVWAIFPETTEYFDPSRSNLMLNYRVRDLDALLKTLREEAVWVDEKRQDEPYGKFGWIMDPDGNRTELWEPRGQ
jgi:catechol 2,3-dioxygenase-like lactoylglutathione lyase family enzyme